MAQNYIFSGERVTWLNDSGSDVVSGQPVKIGGMSGVAMVDIEDGESGTVGLEGVWEFERAVAVDMPDPGTRMYALPAGTVTDDPAAVGAFFIGVSHSTDTSNGSTTSVQILLQNEGNAAVAAVVAPIVPSNYTAIPGTFADEAAARAAVNTLATEVEARDDAQTAKINEILTALKAAGLMEA